MSTSTPHFFMSYSREDVDLQRRIIAGLRGRGLNVWVDLENLIPGSPAWEREIERSIRGAAGIIVLLSPDSNDSERVRREISFAEQNDKQIFPVLTGGDEDDSVPLRLSNHQRVDLRRNSEQGLDELANALRDHIGMTMIGRRPKPGAKQATSMQPTYFRKFALPGLLALIGLMYLAGFVIFARFIFTNIRSLPTPTQQQLPTSTSTLQDVDPVVRTNTPILIDVPLTEPSGKIVYTCQVAGDEVCIVNADGSDWRQLTNSPSASYYASLAPDGQSLLYIGKATGNTEIYEFDLRSGRTTQLTHFEHEVGSPLRTGRTTTLRRSG